MKAESVFSGLFRYPMASCSPPTASSPTSPKGKSWNDEVLVLSELASMMKQDVVSRGTPMFLVDDAH
jgi:hypothetical protein